MQERVRALTDPRSEWPDRPAAAKLLGKSITTIRNLERRGKLTAVQVDKTWRIDPDELESVDVDAADEFGVSQVITSLVGLLKQAQTHAEKTLELIVVPSQQLHAALAASNASMAARVETLEKKNSEMIDAGEKALSLQHERQLATTKYEAAERRKNRAFDELAKVFPELAKRVVGAQAAAHTNGASNGAAATPSPNKPTTTAPPTSPAVAPSTPAELEEVSFVVHRRLCALTDEQLTSMHNVGLLTGEEVAAFRAYRAELEKAATPPAESEKESTTP